MKLKYDDLLGKEFEIGGTGENNKYDCYNLCRELYKRIGKDIPMFNSPNEPNLIEEVVIKGRELFKELDKPEPYCLVLFTLKFPYVSHVGVVLEDCRRFIHIMPKSKVTVERLDDISWNHRVRGYLSWLV
jgi:cell wall-associated NlpC family hydrolase